MHISINSPTFTTPVRDIPTPVYCRKCLLLAEFGITSALTKILYFEVNFVHPMRFGFRLRRFRCLRFTVFVTYNSARLAMQCDRFRFCNRTFAGKICQASLGARQSRVTHTPKIFCIFFTQTCISRENPH